MDEQTNPTMLEETTATRRVVAKGAAAAGLAALFAAVASGRVLADEGPDEDDTAEVDDSPDTSPDLDDSPGTTPDEDDDETTSTPKVKSKAKKQNASRGRGKKQGHR